MQVPGNQRLVFSYLRNIFIGNIIIFNFLLLIIYYNNIRNIFNLYIIIHLYYLLFIIIYVIHLTCIKI